MLIRSCFRLFSEIHHCSSRGTISQRLAPVLTRIGGLSIHTTNECRDLMEFFEDKKNWGKNEIRSGRSWRTDDLRLKSNEDLHKLWYVLLKEKNMLLTTEEFCKENYILFPSPERIDKVEESMKNLETVVRERNKAYYLLETGQDGERPGVMIRNAIGLPVYHRQTQHFVPKYANKWWKKNFLHHFDYQECREFLALMREKRIMKDQHVQRLEKRKVKKLLERFQNMDKEYLAELYPRVDVKKLVDEVSGHWQR